MTFRSNGLAIATVATLFGLAAGAVTAQNRPLERADEVREEVLGEDGEVSRGSADDRRDQEEAAADSTPFGVDLRSLELISHQDKASMSPSPGSEAIVIDPELPAPDDLRAMLEPFIGRPMSMALLSEIGKEVVLAWRESDYPLVDVYYPEQNITGGRLQIVVREAVLGEKATEGAVHSREDYLLSQLRVAPGDRINRRIVESDLDWLNENPIRQVNLIYDRGSTDGTSDILLDVTEEKPLTAYAGFANTGVDSTGEEEWSFGFNYYNPFDLEHMIGYHFATDAEWDNLEAHSLYYEAYLPWRHTLRLLGAYVESESLDTIPANVEGESRQFTTEYRIPLGRPDFNRQWRHSFTFAFDYKSTNTDLLFGGLTFFGTEVEVGQFRGEYEFAVPDDLGYTRVTFGLTASPGDLFDNNDDASFDLARVGSDAGYWYGYTEVERVFKLPRDFSFRMRANAQATGDRLTSTEQMLAGGYLTVRGFDESIARGDSGLITSLELISPEFSVFQRGNFAFECEDAWNAFIFYDAAALDISDPLPGESAPSLQSIGLGMHCRFGDRGYARAAYGWALQSHGVPPDDEDGGKFHFGVTLIY